MLAALWEPVLVGTLVVATVLMSAMVVGGLLVWRYSRRKWRAFHSHGAVVGAMALWEAMAAGGFRHRAPWSPEDVYRWTPRRVRKELWRSVDRADAAVRAASDAGAPTASLPSVCRRLNDAAVGLDRILRIETSGTAPAEVVSQVIEVIQAASDVQRAAVASASDATGQQVRDLVGDADHEIQCLDAGLASAQAALPRRRR